MGTKKKSENFIREVTNEKEWASLCLYQGGLTVVDIYSEWAGPCTAMAGALKKIKLEVGDDSLLYAMARADTIPILHPFKGHCKPTWLFMASGQPVAVMHGANAPLMKVMVAEEMEKERQVQAGEVERKTITLLDAVPASEMVEEPAPSSNNEWLNEMKNQTKKKNENKPAEAANNDSSAETKTDTDAADSGENNDNMKTSAEAKNCRLLLLNNQLSEDPEKLEKLKVELNGKGLIMVHIVPIIVEEDDIDGVEDDSLKSIASSVDSTALVLTDENKDDTENEKNANSKYEELFTGPEANANLNVKLELDDNQKLFCPDPELSSKLMKKLTNQSLIMFKVEKSEEEVKTILDKMNDIKIVKTKNLKLEKEVASQLVNEDADMDTVISALTEEECLAVLVTGVEVDEEGITDHLLIKHQITLGIISSIFAA